MTDVLQDAPATCGTPTTAVTSAADHVVAAAAQGIAALAAETPRVRRWAEEIVARLRAGGMVLAAGNGGSATHASHLAGELVVRFRAERGSLRAVSLGADGSVLTAIGNDYGFEHTFSRQIEGLARRGDVLVLFSTSGRSPNVLAAARAGRRVEALVLAVTGSPECELAQLADDALTSPAPDTASVQDVHHVAVHALCAEVDALVASTGAVPESGS